MSLLSLLAIFFAIATSAREAIAGSTKPRATLFMGKYCQGKPVEIESYVEDLSKYQFGWNQGFGSVKLTGIWIFYKLKEYNNLRNASLEYIFGRSEDCVNFADSDVKVSSARFSGSAADYQSNGINLYSGTYFQGQEWLLSECEENLAINHTSLIVTGNSPWTLYERRYFKGKSICIQQPKESLERKEPSILEDVGVVENYIRKIGSARPGCFGNVKVQASQNIQGEIKV